ncbi:hypothetical protein U719_12060 [Exiguobacterium sp. MH3]|nr:hypothetical protein U719_12060 [Exiguobacterium sp. MH3]
MYDSRLKESKKKQADSISFFGFYWHVELESTYNKNE